MVPTVPPAHNPYPCRPGNRLRHWIDGVPFYSRLLDALQGARHSVWGVISFVHDDFCFPDGTLLWDALDACTARGVDVRLLFWRNPAFPGKIFHGTPAQLAFLQQRGTVWRARWDASGDPLHCHHQKAWVLDAGQPGEVAFVGGMTLGRTTIDDADHRRPHSRHDIFAELHGPAVLDVCHNVVQRWNEARRAPGTPPPWPDAAQADDLHVPAAPAPPCGPVPVQVSRTLGAGRYALPPRHPGSVPRSPLDGETAILAQYRAAFAAATRSIYIENQHPGEVELLGLLDAALQRGVEVILVVPGEPLGAIWRARQAADAWSGVGTPPRYHETFRRLDGLARHPNFTLITLANDHGEIYVHAKVCVVDGAWGTVGSANFVDISLQADHTELNLSYWDPTAARALLDALIAEHAGLDVSACGDREALQRLAQHARDNAARRQHGLPMRRHACARDPRTYARTPAAPTSAGAGL